MKDNKCPKCGGIFKKGVIPDKDEPILSRDFMRWEEKMGTLRSKDAKIVETHRCEKCGYLESYAK